MTTNQAESGVRALAERPFAVSGRQSLPSKINLKLVEKVIVWVEAFYFDKRRFPADTEFLTEFNFSNVKPRPSRGPKKASPSNELAPAASAVERFEKEAAVLLELKLTREFRAACLARGIDYDPFNPAGDSSGRLSAEQVACISVLTNFADTRPQGIKLQGLGISAEQLNGWLVNSAFQRTLQARADEQLGNIYPEAVTSLNRKIKQGNVTAIKFYFEITGRAVAPETVNLKSAMQNLIESIQKHVKDPAVLEAIARDFNSITSIGAD